MGGRYQHQPLKRVFRQPQIEELRDLVSKALDFHLVWLGGGLQRRTHQRAALLVSARFIGQQLVALGSALRVLDGLDHPPLVTARSDLEDPASAGIANYHPGALHRISKLKGKTLPVPTIARRGVTRARPLVV